MSQLSLDLKTSLIIEEDRLVAHIIIAEHLKKATVDTGATTSFMKESFYHKIKDKCIETTHQVNILLADGSTQVSNDAVDCSVEFGYRKGNVTFVIMSLAAEDVVLGFNFLRNFGVIISCAGHTTLCKAQADNNLITNTSKTNNHNTDATTRIKTEPLSDAESNYSEDENNDIDDNNMKDNVCVKGETNVQEQNISHQTEQVALKIAKIQNDIENTVSSNTQRNSSVNENKKGIDDTWKVSVKTGSFEDNDHDAENNELFRIASDIERPSDKLTTTTLVTSSPDDEEDTFLLSQIKSDEIIPIEDLREALPIVKRLRALHKVKVHISKVVVNCGRRYRLTLNKSGEYRMKSLPPRNSQSTEVLTVSNDAKTFLHNTKESNIPPSDILSKECRSKSHHQTERIDEKSISNNVRNPIHNGTASDHMRNRKPHEERKPKEYQRSSSYYNTESSNKSSRVKNISRNNNESYDKEIQSKQYRSNSQTSAIYKNKIPLLPQEKPENHKEHVPSNESSVTNSSSFSSSTHQPKSQLIQMIDDAVLMSRINGYGIPAEALAAAIPTAKQMWALHPKVPRMRRIIKVSSGRYSITLNRKGIFSMYPIKPKGEPEIAPSAHNKLYSYDFQCKNSPPNSYSNRCAINENFQSQGMVTDYYNDGWIIKQIQRDDIPVNVIAAALPVAREMLESPIRQRSRKVEVHDQRYQLRLNERREFFLKKTPSRLNDYERKRDTRYEKDGSIVSISDNHDNCVTRPITTHKRLSTETNREHSSAKKRNCSIFPSISSVDESSCPKPTRSYLSPILSDEDMEDGEIRDERPQTKSSNISDENLLDLIEAPNIPKQIIKSIIPHARQMMEIHQIHPHTQRRIIMLDEERYRVILNMRGTFSIIRLCGDE